MAHRRQIAQWAGTRTTHPGGRGSRPVLAQNQGVRVPIPAGAFYAPKNTPQGVFVQLKCCFGGTGLPEPGEPAADHGGTGRPCQTTRFLKEKVRTPKASLVGEK